MDTEINIRVCYAANSYSLEHPFIKNTKDLAELDSLNKEYTKIYIGDILNYINPNQILPILQKIKSKLVQGGKLIIEEYDQTELCFAVVNGTVNSNDFNNITRYKINVFSLEDLLGILQQAGFQILIKEIDALKHLIECA